MRIIDAERLKVVLENNFSHTPGAEVVKQLIDAQPTICDLDEVTQNMIDQLKEGCGKLNERLTMCHPDFTYTELDPVDVLPNEYSPSNFEKILAKLGHYEDLEEDLAQIFGEHEDLFGILVKAIEECTVKSKLQARESSDKQKRMLEIPCAIGDEVYGIRLFHSISRIRNGIVSDMYVTKEGKLQIVVKNVCRGSWGEKIFGTYEAAEAALKEREGK